MGPIGWLLQWPVRALVLLLVAAMPLGVELSSFSTALGSAALIGLLGTLLIVPLKLLLALPWAVASLGGLLAPVSWLFNWLITVILFSLAAAWLWPPVPAAATSRAGHVVRSPPPAPCEVMAVPLEELMSAAAPPGSAAAAT